MGGYTLDKAPHREEQPFALSFAPAANLKFPVCFTCRFFVLWEQAGVARKKLETRKGTATCNVQTLAEVFKLLLRSQLSFSNRSHVLNLHIDCLHIRAAADFLDETDRIFFFHSTSFCSHLHCRHSFGPVVSTFIMLTLRIFFNYY